RAQLSRKPSQFFTPSKNNFDFSPIGQISSPRPVPIRSAQRWSRGVERDAEVRKLCWGLECLQGSSTRDLNDGRGPGPRQEERTARVNVRASARTNGERRRHLSTLGHPASRQIHPRAERSEKLLPRP